MHVSRLKNTYKLYNTVFAAHTILTQVGQNNSTKMCVSSQRMILISNKT
jgi:hypothetical protein